MLAGVEKPTTGEVDEEVTIAYKPQYIVTDFEGTVSDFLYMNAPSFGSKIFESEIMKPFALEEMLDKNKFMRVSKSALINLDKVRSITPDEDRTLIAELSGKKTVRVSRKNVADFKNRIGAM